MPLDERLDLQTRLTRAGFDTLGVDGKMGPNTIAAVKGFQKSKGIVPDGYPSLDVLNKLD
jgi:peptidoglycan hydrolase-like protein with peptidoglycan-binding domain